MANQNYKIELTALDKTKAAFTSVKNSLSKVGGAAMGVTKVLGGITLAGAAAATTLALVAKKSFDFADAIGKVSTRTGLATDTIQAFQIAAIESGSELEIANKSLEKFTRSVGDAQRGLKTQTDIFKDLGVSIKDANGNTKSMDILLREVSDAFSTLKSQSEKATIAANLFGRAGVQIIDVLDDGGAAFDGYIQKAREYGILLSEDSIRKSEKFNDTLALIKRQITVATAAISIAFLPILQDLSERFSTNFKEITTTGGSIEAFGEMIRTKLIDGLKSGIRGFGDISVEIQKAAIRLDILGLRFRDFGQSIMDFPFFMGIASLNNFIDAGEKVADVLGFAADEAIAFNDEIRQLEGELEKVKSPADAIIATIDKYIESLGEGDEANLTFLNTVRAMVDGIEAETTNIQNPLEVYIDQLTTAEGRTKDWQTTTVNAFKKAEDALMNFVTTGKQKFKDLVNSIMQDILRLAIRQQIIAPLMQFYQSFTTPIPATIPSTPTTSSTPITPKFAGGGYTGMGARAGGLDGKGGFMAMLHPNESVIDHSKGQSGNIVINQSVNFATGVQDTVKNEVLQLLPEIAETSKGAVLEAMSRGGNFRRGLR